MASRRAATGLGGSVIVVSILLVLGYVHIPAFARLTHQVLERMGAQSEPPQLPDAGAIGDELAAGLIDALDEMPNSELPGEQPSAPSSEVNSTRPDSSTDTGRPSIIVEPAPDAGLSADALGALDALPVSNLASTTAYSRDQFGSAWTDDHDEALGHNGCDTRTIWSVRSK